MPAFLDFRYTVVYISLVVLFSASVGGCSAGITRDELLTELQADAPLLVVDVRTQGEYDRAHVPGAVHIPFYSIGSGLRAIGQTKQESVVLYCEHGPRAVIAGFSLYLSGYEKVFSLEGHMKAWRKNEFPIEIITQ
jgi:rhodanese-related sulfurtransferase